MQGRHEIKHYISLTDYYMLRARLGAVLKLDEHAGKDGTIKIRSLYFETPDNKALKEKLDGIKNRDKYRFRYYDDNTDFIKLEKKSKRGNVCIKTVTKVSKEEVQQIIDGKYDWMLKSDDKLIFELGLKMRDEGFRPRTIVEYLREPYTYAPGNVRITIDRQIRTGLASTDFLNPDSVTIPVLDNAIILEVKWDAYLPDIVRDLVQLPNRRSSAYSKYAACRAYD